VEDKHVIELQCAEMEKKQQFKTMGIQSMDECHDVVMNYIDKGVMMLVVVNVIISLYFLTVIHTHWKNHGVRFERQVDETQ